MTNGPAAAAIFNGYPLNLIMHILIVEPNEGLRRALALVLETFEHTIILTCSGHEALGICAKSSPAFDLIIVDDDITDLSVPDFVMALHAQEHAENIMVFSDFVGFVRCQEYKRLGVVGVLAKPFDLVDLRQWLGCLSKCFPKKGEPRDLPVECKCGKTVECWGPLRGE